MRIFPTDTADIYACNPDVGEIQWITDSITDMAILIEKIKI